MSAKNSPKGSSNPEEKESTATLLPEGFQACIVAKPSDEPSVGVLLPPPEDTSSTVSTVSLAVELNERGVWGRQLDFLLSCIGYAVGLGNIWRFPYLCYTCGGGAFLIPYLFFLMLCGIPMFFLEMSFGQFASLGPISIWKICPLFKGLGYGMVMVSGIVCIYYNIIIAWTLYYIYQSYNVPWATCDNWWNTPDCVKETPATCDSNFTSQNYTSNRTDCFTSNGMNTTLHLLSNTSKRTSSEEFWLYNVLHQSSGIDNLGEIQLPLLLALFIAWFIVFLCLMKGVKSSGKIVYISATFPYFVLLCLLVRGLTLPGAWDGIVFYLYPRWELLLSFKVWGYAATQIFYSVGASWGVVLNMASYSKFYNNVYRDALFIPILNCCTSILAGFVVFSIIGFMAYETGNSIEDVVSQGPGLAFVVYPEAISRLPLSTFWSFLFFVMVFTIGLDSQFGMFETTISAFLDEYPVLKKHKILFKGTLCFVMFLLGLPCITEGGMYVLQLMDWYSAAFSLMVISLMELICISWVYGIDRFFMDISLMIKRTPPFWWKLCWCYITPGTIICILLFIAINHEAVTYDDYIYPEGSIVVGWMIAMCSIVPIPAFAIYQLIKAEGTLKERLLTSLQPTDEWGPALEEHRILYKKSLALVPSRFPPKREPVAIPAASAEQGNAEGLCMVRVDDALLTAESAV
ncbi:sodium- and chloride-dependent glycine transporter 2 [Trichonephila inaurata madagascariensis]|uniref:Sodium-dependent nutrient amino acid transporter 1 n=1 Tax=Trichonephila inaurata madagascariensis TaxID=2747483 RepID=A0A8X6XSG0_9ARAC|nr:sodium- and chloride-dependent glycine transporter 2 [Trichonephila inaurata madagascariensis]